MLRMLQTMDENAPYAICADGNLDDLEQITEENLYEYYNQIIKSDLIDIFIIGNLEEENIKKIINEKFKINTLKKPSEKHYIKHNKINKKAKIKKETKELDT